MSMNVSIEIPDVISEIIKQRADAAGMDLATFVRQIVVENTRNDESDVPSATSVDEFVRRQNAWVNLHPQLDHAIDDSRESIYAGRE